MYFATEFDRLEGEFSMTIYREDEPLRIQVIGNFTRRFEAKRWQPAEGGQFEIQAVYTMQGDDISSLITEDDKEAILMESENHYPAEDDIQEIIADYKER